MKNGLKPLSRCALASLQVLLFSGLLLSAAPENPNVKPTVEVTAVASREFNELENSVMRLFKQAVQTKGIRNLGQTGRGIVRRGFQDTR